MPAIERKERRIAAAARKRARQVAEERMAKHGEPVLVYSTMPAMQALANQQPTKHRAETTLGRKVAVGSELLPQNGVGKSEQSASMTRRSAARRSKVDFAKLLPPAASIDSKRSRREPV